MADPLDILTGTIRPRHDDTWSTLAGLAQAVASIPERRARAAAQRAEMESQALLRQAQMENVQAQAQERQQKAADLKALDAAYQQPGGRDVILNAVPGHLRGAVAQQWAELDESNAKRQAAKEKAREAADDTIARGLTVVKHHNYDPMFAQGTISTLKSYYQDEPERLKELQLVEAAIHENPTRDHVKMIADALIARSATQRKAETDEARAGADIAASEVQTALRAQELAGEKPIQPTDAARIEAENARAAAARAAQAVGQAETAKHDRAMEAASFGNLAVAKEREAREAAALKATGGAKLSATAIEKIAGIDQSLNVVKSLNELKKPEWLGPIAGRQARYSINIPGVKVSDELARFAAETATLKNSVVKAITGAQMSEPEAKRIMQQVPDFEDKPNVWQQKLEATKENLSTLKRRTIELSGGSAGTESATTPKRIKVTFDKDGNLVRQ